MDLKREVLLLDLGLKDYHEVWKLQKEICVSRAEGKCKDVFIMVEHPHTLTLGRRGSMENVLHCPPELPIYHIERGGDVTYHGPGQLVGYPIVHIGEAGIEVHGYVRKVEEVLMDSLKAFGIHSFRKEGHAGVWVADFRKIASIGIAIQRWVTYHGFALNVNTDMSYFKLIRPCGLESEALTSMREILGREADFFKVKEEVISRFEEVFGVKVSRFDETSEFLEEVFVKATTQGR